MKYLAVVGLLLIPAMVVAQGHVCPSEHAANKGYSAFEEFHNVMAPAWHTAYPANDVKALYAAGPEFERLFPKIAEIEAKMHSPFRKAAFLTHREEFAKLVKEFATAAQASDSGAVMTIMPKLHDAFEMTASALAPMPYPQVDGILVTVGLILDQHMPLNNTEGIVGSTATLTEKMASLTPESLPEPLQPQKEEHVKEFAAWKLLAAEMQTCCDKNDMTGYRKAADSLRTKLSAFVEMYL